ncbi:isopentenyl phosphate kinase [Vibrio mediterranei]|uniref:isopentenyl phosphate kinase n=1 Tax=Vibrio mediterranei TaxID=689 RepID=UPI0038CEB3CB
MDNIDLKFDQESNSKGDSYIIKLGGSISTNKDGRYELDVNNIKLIGNTLYKYKIWERFKIVLVFGGGSFGNVAPREYDIISRKTNSKVENISKMTTIMFSMLSDITSILISCGVPAYPFQCSAIVNQLPNGLFDIHTGSISSALEQGILPVITGDLVFNNDGDFMIFSSDNVPELIADKINVSHILYYSDVDGLYSDINEKKVITNIKPKDIEGYKSIAGPSSRQDITGGMYNKINQIQRLVNKGLSVELLSFSFFSNVGLSISKKKQFGTFFEAGGK